MTRSILKRICFLSFAFFLLFGCSKTKGLKTIEGDPEILYKEGLALFNKRIYPDALKKFEDLKSSFPDSPPYTTLAELKVADCHFLSGSYVEAVAAYEEFRKIHPTHGEIPYVQYQVGMSYFSQMLSADRDQTPTRKALSSFEYLIANYPPSLFTEKATGRIETCRKRLADHEFYIGEYYYNNGKFLAASRRFEAFLEHFPKSDREDRALFLLEKSYLELDQTEKAEGVYARLITEYPNTSYAKEAKAILDQNIKSKERSAQKGKALELTETDRVNVAVVKFDEEGRKPLSLTEERKPPLKSEAKSEAKPEPKPQTKQDETRETPRPVPVEVPKPVPIPVPSKSGGEPEKESRPKAGPQGSRRGEASDEPLRIALTPSEEERKGVGPESRPKGDLRPAEETRKTSLPGDPSASMEKGKSRQGIGALGDLGYEKIAEPGEPIDISADKVESYTRDNLIIFKGSVIARQKDIVIYADSIEALIMDNGKGIERVVAAGNVKVQQGTRVANCQKAVFYNLDKKVILTGAPTLWEGENMVSGEEIVFDIEQSRVDVRGGTGGRGKVKIQP